MRVGILGGGQLGQMLMLAGYPLGITTVAFDPVTDGPAGQVGQVTAGDITDTPKVRRWASQVDVVTYESENYPAELVSDLSEVRPVQPGPQALAPTQDRWAEKRLFNSLEIPVAPFRLIESESDLRTTLREFEGPLVVKTRTGGYDGRGQVVHREGDDPAAVLDLMANNQVIAEDWVPFQAEVSMIGVRNARGEIRTYPLVENEHRQGILHASLAPARVAGESAEQARSYVETLLKQLQYVGVLALEMFVVNGRLLANEMAPRVHNSGHWTIEGAETSQFENHLRAICGLPLGSTELRSPTAMINIVGRDPSLTDLLEIPGVHVHLYGKSARPGRKLGHVTITASTDAQLHERIALVERVVDNQLS